MEVAGATVVVIVVVVVVVNAYGGLGQVGGE